MRPPQGCRAGAEIQQRGKEAQMGQSEWSPCPAPQEPQGQAGVSQQLVGALACPQQELLGEAEPGLAAGCVRLMATLGDALLGLCLSSGWEASLSLCSASGDQEQDFVLSCHQAWLDPFFCQKIGKGDLDKGASAVGCCQTSGSSVRLLKGNLNFVLDLQGEQQFDTTLCLLCSNSGLPFNVFLSNVFHSAFS